MAVWQFDLFAVPQDTLVQRVGSLPLVVSSAALDGVTFPEDLRSDLHSAFGALLPLAVSWSPDLIIWGDEEGDRIDWWQDRGEGEEIRIRVDARSASPAFLLAVAALAHEHGLVFVGEDGRVLPARARTLLGELMTSDAARFVADPKGFLESLARDEQD